MWKPCSHNYECSDDGHIRNNKTKHVLKEFDSCNDGYLRTQFDGKTQLVHRVIAKTFLEPIEGKDYVNHIDGNKQNNAISNLEWCTFSENIQHAYNHNLNHGCKFDVNGRAKLSCDDVHYIRKNYKRFDPVLGTKGLAKKYNVARQTISAVISGQNWSELKD